MYKHASFLILLISSLVFFIVNILLKKNMSSEDYGNYALLLTFISINFSLGLFGWEQVILRYSYFSNNRFLINKDLLKSFFISSILSITIFITMGKLYFEVDNISLFVLSVSTIMLMLIYNIYRLMQSYVYSQLIYNIWKIVLLIYILFSIKKDIYFIQVFQMITFSIFILFLVSLAIFLFNYKIKTYMNSSENVKVMQVNFFISMFILTFLSYGDRFIVEYYYTIEAAGEYFYYVTVVLFPYILFQAYFGFKELPEFRKKFTMAILKRKIFQAIILGVTLSIVLAIAFIIINNLEFQFLENIKIDNYYLILILMLTGIVKIVYSILSSAVGATSPSSTIKSLNYYTIISTIGAILLFLLLEQKSIELIAILYLALWLIRSYIYYNKGLLNA